MAFIVYTRKIWSRSSPTGTALSRALMIPCTRLFIVNARMHDGYIDVLMCVYQVLVVLFGSIISGAPLVALCFYVIIFAWMGK